MLRFQLSHYSLPTRRLLIRWHVNERQTSGKKELGTKVSIQTQQTKAASTIYTSYVTGATRHGVTGRGSSCLIICGAALPAPLSRRIPRARARNQRWKARDAAPGGGRACGTPMALAMWRPEGARRRLLYEGCSRRAEPQDANACRYRDRHAVAENFVE